MNGADGTANNFFEAVFYRMLGKTQIQRALGLIVLNSPARDNSPASILGVYPVWNEGVRAIHGGERGIRTPDRAFDPITV
jgi:hypothetical protein